MEIVTLFCAVVDAGGEVKGVPFPIDIDSANSVGHLKRAIKAENPTIKCAALELTLWFATKDGKWLSTSALKTKAGVSNTVLNTMMKAEDQLESTWGDSTIAEGEKLPEPALMQIHVLVLPAQPDEPVSTTPLGKRVSVALTSASKRFKPQQSTVPASEWFPDRSSILEGRIPERMNKYDGEVDNGEDKKDYRYEYLQMTGFPPLIHPVIAHDKILVRPSYLAIFQELLGMIKEYIEKCDINLVVTGNPGIGKSRFYLYCAFRLIRDVLGVTLPAYTLVLNCAEHYHRYCANEKTFYKVTTTQELDELQASLRIIRLIDGKSSMLCGWKGTSILFAPPRVPGLKEFKKAEGCAYISPVWTLDELRASSRLLVHRLKLSDADVCSRYAMYGGIPRKIFTAKQTKVTKEIEAAVKSFSASDIVNLVKEQKPVSEESSSILCMMPTAENFEEDFKLEFLSKDIAKKVTDQTAVDLHVRNRSVM